MQKLLLLILILSVSACVAYDPVPTQTAYCRAQLQLCDERAGELEQAVDALVVQTQHHEGATTVLTSDRIRLCPILVDGTPVDVVCDFRGSARLIRALQQKLASLGHYDGPINAIFGPRTLEAVNKYAEARELPVAGGLLTVQLLDSLGIEL